MKEAEYKKILNHPDREELIAKLVCGIEPSDIHEWLKVKYDNINDAKFVITEKTIKTFKTQHLDFYNDMQIDLAKTKTAIATSSQDQLQLAIKSNPAYKDALLRVANNELDIEKTMAMLAINIETRMAQVFDEMMEDPRNINTKIDRMFNEYADTLGNLLDKYHKWKEKPVPDQVIQHNVTLQVVDQHISVFHDVIKEVLSQMDLETSMYFLEVFNDKMGKLKQPVQQNISQDMKMADVKMLSESINQKINQ